jgi:hypothetical protein
MQSQGDRGIAEETLSGALGPDAAGAARAATEEPTP